MLEYLIVEFLVGVYGCVRVNTTSYPIHIQSFICSSLIYLIYMLPELHLFICMDKVDDDGDDDDDYSSFCQQSFPIPDLIH